MIEVKNISKRYGDTVVLDNVSLHVESGELLALLGPSGSGKTTLLRIIAGMEVADSGCVFINGREVGRQKAGERRVGFVFQHYALFKHMTVFENVAFGLRVRPRAQRPDEPTLRRKVMDLLELVHLDNFYDRYPSQLSGGQRQRVALARALAVEPQLLLLDEPFGALDSKVRKELRRWMRRLHDDIHITSIFVTHDQEEAMEVSDRVVVMSNGKIEQVGTPGEVYHKPANSFVYDFLGNYNVFEGWRDEEGNTHLLEVEPRDPAFVQPAPAPQRSMGWINRYPEISHLIRKILPGFGSAPVLPAKKKRSADTVHKTPVKLFTRPHELYIAKTPDDEEYIFARVIHINPAGPLFKVEMESRGGNILTAEVPKEVIDMLSIAKNDIVYVRPKNTRVFDDIMTNA